MAPKHTVYDTHKLGNFQNSQDEDYNTFQTSTNVYI